MTILLCDVWTSSAGSAVLSQLNHNPGAAAAVTKVKLARKTHTDEKMEVDGNEWRRSSDMEASNAQRPSTDATESQEPPFAFKMVQELHQEKIHLLENGLKVLKMAF